jgi:ferrochelatase
MKQAVLLLAHGAPDRLDQMEEYLLKVRGGRPLPPPAVEEIRRRYAQVGGSPLLARTLEQARALESELGVTVYVGMRNWSPYIRDAVSQMVRDGVARAVAICMAPQYSTLSVGLYMRHTREAIQSAGARLDLSWVESFYDHPMLIGAFAQRVRAALDGRRLPVLFTAHSLPERVLAAGDPYAEEARATASAVAAELGLSEWDFAYQSQGLSGEKWLGPPVESRIDALCAAGVREFVLAPIGFVCDHVEVLYDIDILFCRYAAERGLTLRRTESLNDCPLFIRALAELARQRLQ